MTNFDGSLQDGNDRSRLAFTNRQLTQQRTLALRLRCGLRSLPEEKTMGAISRCVATLRGEQCFITVNGHSERNMYRRGQEIVAGDRSYVVTRILRARTDPRVPSWEIWARPAKN